MSSAFDLGPFRLFEPIAAGASGQVWRAEHRGQGIPVAVKVIPGSEHEAFKKEVRAAAALDHPGVVMVLDHGVVPQEVGLLSKGLIREGAPWLAMEYASGGTLLPLLDKLDWRAAKAVLLAVLDALAHAHAHGVIHRDFKPSNVLIATKDDARPGLKLADFGLAHATGDIDRSGTEEDIAGTPRYMAPEQVNGLWRDYGPWTDLYALGTMAYRIVCRRFPYGDRRGHSLLAAHVITEPDKPVPRGVVPAGVEDWLLALLEKDVNKRIRHAADAAAWLLDLGDTEDEFPILITSEEGVLEIEPSRSSITLSEEWRLTVNNRDDRGLVTRGHAPSPPHTWRRAVPDPPPMQLVGAGVSLYGLRQIPLIGRERERDWLWSTLVDVIDNNRQAAVLIRGNSGAGKSALVRWLCQRAEELGCAHPVFIGHSVQNEGGEGQQRMGQTELRTLQLGGPEVFERVEEWLRARGCEDDDEIAVLAAALSPATPLRIMQDSQEKDLFLSHPGAFYTATRRGVERMCLERPAIVWLDDVQWGAHGLGLMRNILRRREEDPWPMLLVATVQEEALADRPEEQKGLEKLLALDGITELSLGRLPKSSQVELIQRLLGLDTGLAARIEERTGGNPMFAVQLVGDWVERGLLEVGKDGFKLAKGVKVKLPDDVHALWRQRVERLLEGFEPKAGRFLEVAAALGTRVNAAEWHQACDDPAGFMGGVNEGDKAIRDGVVEKLMSERLAEGTLDEWSFVHGMLRESILRLADEGGRIQVHHFSCATMLWSRAPTPVQAPAERLGRHLLAAGRAQDAIAPLLGAVERRLVTGGPESALALLDTVEQAMTDEALPDGDKRWSRLWSTQERVLRRLGRPDDALEVSDRALARALEQNWGGPSRFAMRARGLALLALGRHDDAVAQFEQLRDIAAVSNAMTHMAQAMMGLGEVHFAKGAYAMAISQLTMAGPLFIGSGEQVDGARATRLIGDAHLALGDAKTALEFFEKALNGFELRGMAMSIAETLERIGEAHQRSNDLPAAEEALRKAISRYEALGYDGESETRMRLALVVAEQGRTDEVWEIVGPLQFRLSQLEHHTRHGANLAMQLVRAAAEEDWSSLAKYQETSITEISHRMIAWPTLIAARIAQERAPSTQARKVKELAKRQWNRLGEEIP